MAFPGTYNISYYRGDTYEFKIYPKDASGAAFPLTGYDLSEGVKFTISSDRGNAGIDDQIEGYSAISADRTHITCAIRPENGNLLRWANQGVLLLNATLTVCEGKPESQHNIR
jgi:hypothetical protein